MGKRTRTSFKTNNTAALKHGGAAAVKAISQGEPFTSPASEMEEQIGQEAQEVGAGEMVRRATIRLETGARLYWNDAQGANARGDRERANSSLKSWGWLQIAALRGWQQVAQLEAAGGDNVIEAALESAKGNNDNNHTD